MYPVVVNPIDVPVRQNKAFQKILILSNNM